MRPKRFVSTYPAVEIPNFIPMMFLLLAVLSAAAGVRAGLADERYASDAALTTQSASPATAGQSGGSKPSEVAQEPRPSPLPDKSSISVNPVTGFGSVSGANYVPLTGKERWKLYRSQTFSSIGAWFGPVTSSIVDQANSQPPEWGGGMEGYGKRLASRFGAGVVQSSTQAVACALLRQDPRYVRSAAPGAWSRMGHAVLFSLLTKTNGGNTTPAVATLGSFYVSGMVSQSWMPSRYTALGDGIRDGNRQVVMSVLLNEIQEFWPEIRRLVFRKP